MSEVLSAPPSVVVVDKFDPANFGGFGYMYSPMSLANTARNYHYKAKKLIGHEVTVKSVLGYKHFGKIVDAEFDHYHKSASGKTLSVVWKYKMDKGGGNVVSILSKRIPRVPK